MTLELSGTTGVKGVAGSVSAPSIVGDDTNTGISFPAADTIKFSTGGVERMSITNSGVSGITTGITMAQQWRITTDFNVSTGDGDYSVTSNWESADTFGYGTIGSNLTESSGIFTFPSTGIYRIFSTALYNNTTGDNYRTKLNIYVTTDNSNYEAASTTVASANTPAEHFVSMNCEWFFDVTDTSTHKFKIVVRTFQDTVKFRGNSNIQETGFHVFRLGDT